jgi:hypothetical protein
MANDMLYTTIFFYSTLLSIASFSFLLKASNKSSSSNNNNDARGKKMPKLRVFAIQIHLLKKNYFHIQIRLNRIGRKANKSEQGMAGAAKKALASIKKMYKCFMMCINYYYFQTLLAHQSRLTHMAGGSRLAFATSKIHHSTTYPRSHHIHQD